MIAVGADRGDLLPDEWTAYLAAVRKVGDAVGNGWQTLAMALQRLEGRE